MEVKLAEKNEVIKDIIDRVTLLEDKQTSVEDESTQVLECNQTFLKPSDILKLCEKCTFKPNSEKDPDIHNQNVHVDSFQCECCVFAGRNKGSLKTHM